jgi:two-component system phosphate regulon sensor histidine kinase PhoR
MRLRSRFTLLFGVLAVLTAVGLIWVFDRTLRASLEDRVTERLTHELEHLADDLARLPPPETDAFLRRAAGRLETRLTLVGADGVVLHETGLSAADVGGMDNHANREEIREALSGGVGRARRESPTQHREMLYLARRLEGGRVLRAAVSSATLRSLESSYLLTSRAAVLLACLLLFLVGFAASSRFSRPIGELTRAASAIARGEFHRSLPAAGGEELQVLGGALQDMKDGLERALDRAESERRLTATVFESLPDGLVVVDAKLHIVEANERFSRMIGIPSPAGRALWDLLRYRPLLECFEATLQGKDVSSRVVRLADDVVWEVLVAPLPEGSRAAAVGVLRDITRLERTESMRRTFVADVSHELRTPIASIAAAAETLADGDTEAEDQARLVSVIRRQAERMRELIDDLTDLAQIESGSIPLERAPVDLLSLLRDVAQELEPTAREKQVTLRVTGDAGATVIGDRRRLGQVARNLLDNAIKFSPAGSPVELEAGLRNGSASFSVADRGPGIPRAERDKIFQRFYQVDRSRSKTRPGTGLGLAIVKHIVHLHGAAVEVDGEVGQGSTFRVLFPAHLEGRQAGTSM